jgi:gamma-glutamyltranspeptidase/glutathione hydrolase
MPAVAQRPAFAARHGIVASAHQLASEAGGEILRRGGNAVDAAVATGLALAVVYPVAGNLGGGGFMLIHLQDSAGGGRGREMCIDFRETAPAAASRDMYIVNDQLIRGPGSSTVGWRASGVPGTVAGLALAFEKYGSGKLSWAEICEPARRLAAEGHVVSPGAAASLRRASSLLEQFDESRRIFMPGGSPLEPGTHWRQPDLADTFSRLQQHGAREFYEGETARRIAQAMSAHGGTITLADLNNYRAVERVPLRGTYRQHEIVTMPPPSSGGLVLLQILGIVEAFDLPSLGQSSAAKYHLFAEAMRRAFRDRAEYLGDPDFAKVPVAELLDRDYLRARMTDFSPDRATPSSAVKPGLGPVEPGRSHRGRTPESIDTTHYSVVDEAGNAVACTYTLNGNFGSGVTIPGTGILMNNEMDDFTAKAGEQNMFGLLQGAANEIAPGKRPLSAMSPTMVFDQGRLLLVTGSPGGPTIINTVLQIITNVIDYKMPIAQAVEAPRIHHQWMPDKLTYERYGLSTDTLSLLRNKGHVVEERASYEGGYQGGAESIWIDPLTQIRHGASDPRKPDAACAGY